jgi:hypothetical protein
MDKGKHKNVKGGKHQVNEQKQTNKINTRKRTRKGSKVKR